MLIGDGTQTNDLTAELQEATREFAGIYERHAYLVYNLALRITCERTLAMTASERSFLEHAGRPEDGAALASTVVAAAVKDARLRPRASGAGGVEEEALLTLTARVLDARERALLALTALTETPTGGAGMKLGVAPSDAEALLDGAYEKLAAARGETPDDARAAYEDWLWAAPPQELWEGLYPKFYRAAERSLQPPSKDDPELTQKLPAQPKAPRRRALSGPKFVLALLLPALVVGGAVAWPQLQPKPAKEQTVAEQTAASQPDLSATDDSGSLASALSDAPTDGSTAPDTSTSKKKRKPLTATQLDQLRRNELKALELYSKRETDRRLTQSQRDYAAQKVALLRDLAERRIQAARHERALARAERRARRKERQLERERREAAKGGQLNVTVDDGSGSGSGDSQPPQKKSGGSTPQDSTDAQQKCLYDPDNGTYICQE